MLEFPYLYKPYDITKALKAEVRCRSQQIGLNVSMKFCVAERYIALSSVVTLTCAQKILEAFISVRRSLQTLT